MIKGRIYCLLKERNMFMRPYSSGSKKIANFLAILLFTKIV